MTCYETPAFDPSIAFSWTLRSEEIARRRRQRPHDSQADRTEFEDAMCHETRVSEHAARYETPAFEPGVAFSWTLRSAEIARRHSRQPLNSKPGLMQLNVLAAA
jgi:hypothetical protein